MPPSLPALHTETLPDSISHKPRHDDIMVSENYNQDGSGIDVDSDSQENMDIDNMADSPHPNCLCLQTVCERSLATNLLLMLKCFSRVWHCLVPWLLIFAFCLCHDIFPVYHRAQPLGLHLCVMPLALSVPDCGLSLTLCGPDRPSDRLLFGFCTCLNLRTVIKRFLSAIAFSRSLFCDSRK